MGRVRVVPATGKVFAGMGTVWENPTRGLPVLNPSSIFPLVDNQQHIEGILDPGSQIIAMAEEVCLDLGLVYDPTVVLHMQSANGEVNPSLGLARNVPMRIGDITLYVQIHIIRSPAYNILLGRPFDVLTESVVRNFANEDQTITIFDPNTG